MDHNLNVYNDFHYEYTDAHLYPPERVILGKFRDHWHRMSVLDIGIGTVALRIRSQISASSTSVWTTGANAGTLPGTGTQYRELFAEVPRCPGPFPTYGSGFDFVLFSMNGLDSLDHAGREKALQEIRKVLAPNGYFFFSTHSLSTFAESRRLPVFRWKSPIRSTYYLSKALWFNFRLKRANRESEESIRAQDWAILKTGDHDFRIDIYHIQPQVQLKELARLGYRVESVLDDRGEEADPVRSGSPWLYTSVVCSQARTIRESRRHSAMGIPTMNRRDLFRGVAVSSGILISAGSLDGCSRSPEGDTGTHWDLWIRIDHTGRVLVHCPRMEMGQGIFNAVRLLVAEEMGCGLDKIDVEHAPLQETFGSLDTQDSSSIRESALLIRRVAAVARTQLMRAAAEMWGIQPSSLRIHDHFVFGPAGQQAGFGDLADAASRLPVTGIIELKPEGTFDLVGTETPGVHAERVIRGEPYYTGDVSLPGMLYAAIDIPQSPGAQVAQLESSVASAMPGVRLVLNSGDAVTVVADSYWYAEKARKALRVTWADPADLVSDSGLMWRQLRAAAVTPGKVWFQRGAAFLDSTEPSSAHIGEFAVGIQPHSTLEPTVCVADCDGDHCRVWAPTQSPWITYRVAAESGLDGVTALREKVVRKATGDAGSRIIVTPMPMGGSYGRRLDQGFVRHTVLRLQGRGRTGQDDLEPAG